MKGPTTRRNLNYQAFDAILIRSKLCDSGKAAEIILEQTFDVALDLGGRHLEAVSRKSPVGFGEAARDHVARVLPLINDLVENARIRVLRDEGRT